ncbi:TPA: hypothetical protein ACX3FR_003894 [Vibrio parahaemolyticus]
MSDQIDNHYISTTSLALLEKSSTAFLIEGLDKLNVNDKPYHVDEWDFSTTHVVGLRNGLIVRFRSTNSADKCGIQDTLYKFYHYYQSKGSLPLSVVAMDVARQSLQKVADCLGGTQWGNLDDNRKLKSFFRNLKQKEYSKAVMNHILAVLNKLTETGFLSSLVDVNALMKCAASSLVKQHVALPHRLYYQVLSHALGVVEKYHPYKDEISSVMEEAYIAKEKTELGERLVDSGRGYRENPSSSSNASTLRLSRAMARISHDIPDFKVNLKGSALREILISCLIVVQGFSGVRLGEAATLNKHRIDKKTVNGKEVVILKGETTKDNCGRPRRVTWQSHFAAKQALELAYDMMESSRNFYRNGINCKEKQGVATSELISHMRNQIESAFLGPQVTRQDGDNYIMSTDTALKTHIKKLEFKATIEDVKEFDMLNPTREGELKVGGTYTGLSSHDFRRTFALFFVRHGFGTASGIKFQFKHQNINMSGYYANNAELARMNDLLMDEDILEDLKEAGIDLGIDIFDEVYNKSEHLSGAQGEKIMEERMKKLEAGESVIMTRDEIEENIRRGNFHIMQLPNGAYCTNGSCDRVCGSSAFRAEIKSCEHELVTDKGAKKIAKQRDRLIAKFTNLNTGDPLKKSILTGLKQKIQVNELTLKAHEIPYLPFNDDIALSKAS